MVHALLCCPNNHTHFWAFSLPRPTILLSSRKLKVKNYGLQETKAGHCTVRIDEFQLVEDQWTPPADFVMDSDAEVMMTWHDEIYSTEV